MPDNFATRLRLMTYNIGGGRKDLGSQSNAVIRLIRDQAPDILGAQEVTELEDLDGHVHRLTGEITQAVGSLRESFFAPTISLQRQFHIQKKLFVHAIFNDCYDWRQGNGLFSRFGFVRLGDSSKPGLPRNIPLFQPPVYEGNRDTDPRFALLARLNCGTIKPFVVVTHLTTLVGERGDEMRILPEKVKEAKQMRLAQSRLLVDLLQTHVLARNELVFLLGDFNAVRQEPAISKALVETGGFFLLEPEDQIGTHPKANEPIDHILVFPGNYRVEYTCRIVDNDNAREASDHLPIVADVTVYHQESPRFQSLGPGVVRMDL